MHKLFGREQELKLLKKTYLQDKSNLIVVYGRRRIGKSYFLKSFCTLQKSIVIEGLENQSTHAQVKNFQKEFFKQTNASLIKNSPFTEWSEVFDFVTSYIDQQKEKFVIVIDEFQWMTVKKTYLVSLVKLYWDREWKDSNKVMLILCGSIASFMINQVIHSKALYGRIDLELQMTELVPADIFKIVGTQLPIEELFKYYLVMGGVPKYFELIDPSESFSKNMEALFFKKTGYFFNEIDKIFYAQFKEAKTYEKIIKNLQREIKTSEELAASLKMPSGGGFNRYVDILAKARFIGGYKLFGAEKSKIKKYRLIDEYLRFYFKYVLSNKKLIQEDIRKNIFRSEVLPVWKPWLGIAFENFCLKYNHIIAQVLEINEQVIDVGPYFYRGEKGFQIDLLFKTNEKEIYLCECKFSENQLSGEIIPEVQRKIELFPLPKGYRLKKVLIAPEGASPAVVKSRYFDRIITYKDLCGNH